MKIFILSLKENQVRYNAMQKQIADFFAKNPCCKDNLEFIFFEGLNADKAEHLRFKRHFPNWLQFLFGDLGAGVYACGGGHTLLWQKCVELNEAIVVLEDDVLLKENFAQGLVRIQESGFEFVRLMNLFDDILLKQELSNQIFFCYGKEGIGAQGYYIKPSAALKFLNKYAFWFIPVDNFMDKFYLHKVLPLVYQPFLIEEQNQISVIGQRKVQKKFYQKICIELMRLRYQLHCKIALFFTLLSLKRMNK